MIGLTPGEVYLSTLKGPSWKSQSLKNRLKPGPVCVYLLHSVGFYISQPVLSLSPIMYPTCVAPVSMEKTAVLSFLAVIRASSPLITVPAAEPTPENYACNNRCPSPNNYGNIKINNYWLFMEVYNTLNCAMSSAIKNANLNFK